MKSHKLIRTAQTQFSISLELKLNRRSAFCKGASLGSLFFFPGFFFRTPLIKVLVLSLFFLPPPTHHQKKSFLVSFPPGSSLLPPPPPLSHPTCTHGVLALCHRYLENGRGRLFCQILPLGALIAIPTNYWPSSSSTPTFFADLACRPLFNNIGLSLSEPLQLSKAITGLICWLHVYLVQQDINAR